MKSQQQSFWNKPLNGSDGSTELVQGAAKFKAAIDALAIERHHYTGKRRRKGGCRLPRHCWMPSALKSSRWPWASWKNCCAWGSAGECGAATTNSIESVWAVLKRGVYGTFHHISPKHTWPLHR